MGVFDSVVESVKSAGDKANSALSSFLDSVGIGTSSDWQGLNPNLIATFYALKSKREQNEKTGEVTIVYEMDKDAGNPIKAPILDGAEMEYTLNWQSPFEQMGTETKAPALTAMLQSGMLQNVYAGLTGKIMDSPPSNDSTVMQTLKDMEGRTGITKLNSTQTFSGMPPVKVTMKLLFRAYSDAESEVMKPITQLLKWALPQKLSNEGTIEKLAYAVTGNSQDKHSFLDALLPSISPTLIAMEYKGRIYKPMVIESISDPITSPTTSDGKYAKAEVSITLSSLTAWDQHDIAKTFEG